MLNKRTLILAITALALVVGGFYLSRDQHQDTHHDHSAAETGSHNEEAEEALERGAHNGRVLKDGDFAVEVTIFENGVPPQFRFYVTDEGKPVKPNEIALTAELTRLGNKTDRFSFLPENDYFKSSDSVKEPHSFKVKIKAIYNGKQSTWTYDSFEGRTEITPAAAKAAGIETLPAGAATIRETVTLNGNIALDPNKTVHIKARFPGVVREVNKRLGEQVKAGDVLARVESNESLQIYPIKSPISGLVLTRSTNPGDVAGDEPLFVVSDLSGMWAEFHVFHRDLASVKVGNPVNVHYAEDDTEGAGVISAFLPLAEASSQTMLARVKLDNSKGHWRAGMNITGKVVVNERQVPLAVKNSALQRFRDFDVVFAKVGNTYEVRMLELGASDGEWTEVKSGLELGETYVTNNSFLVKADIEKAGASHDH